MIYPNIFTCRQAGKSHIRSDAWVPHPNKEKRITIRKFISPFVLYKTIRRLTQNNATEKAIEATAVIARS
jgi:hypothetical protein